MPLRHAPKRSVTANEQRNRTKKVCWIEKFTRINVYHAENFAYFLGRLKSTPGWRGLTARSFDSGIRQRPFRPKRTRQGESSHRPGGTRQRAVEPGPAYRLPKRSPMANLFMTV